MYDIYHEMDITHFIDTINELWDNYYKETNLKRLRKLAGLSQRELSELSGVPLRQIQLFEQRQRNINHTKAIAVSYTHLDVYKRQGFIDKILSAFRFFSPVSLTGNSFRIWIKKRMFSVKQ